MSAAMPPALMKMLAAHSFRERPRRVRRGLRGRALNKTAAEHTRLPRRRVIEHAGLAGGDAFFAGDQLDLVVAVAAAQPGRLRRAGRAHPHEHLEPAADRGIDVTIADPVDVA